MLGFSWTGKRKKKSDATDHAMAVVKHRSTSDHDSSEPSVSRSTTSTGSIHFGQVSTLIAAHWHYRLPHLNNSFGNCFGACFSISFWPSRPNYPTFLCLTLVCGCEKVDTAQKVCNIVLVTSWDGTSHKSDRKFVSRMAFCSHGVKKEDGTRKGQKMSVKKGKTN